MRLKIVSIINFSSLIIIFCSLLSSCLGNRAVSLSKPSSIDSIHYASGFTIARHDDFIEVNVRDPWDSTRLLQRYLLVDRTLEHTPQGMGAGTIVKIPVDNIVVYTSVHASIVELLGMQERIAGLCEVKYIESSELQQRISDGKIANLGESTAPNIERMIDIGSEVIISTPFKDCSYGPAEKLGIPIIEGADYMENHPLGRTEWIKFYGLLLGAEQRADSIFTTTCREYNALKKLTEGVTHKPTMIAERKYGSLWFVPSGDSYSGVIYADAGANYIFADRKIGGGSIPMSFESVLDHGIDADVWVIKYYNAKQMSYSDLKAEYAPYANFGAYKNRQIYACNSFSSTYYEDIPMHPHLILKDLIYIFHPNLLPDYTPKYFFRMEE